MSADGTSGSHAGRGGATRARRYAADRVFFPLAAIHGALVVPLSVHGLMTGDPMLPAFAGVVGHARELLFGYALAVVAGFLVTRTTRARIAVLAGLWLLARVAFLVLPGSAAALAANAAFALLLAYLVAPGFLKGAKKLRNRTVGPVLLLLCLAAAMVDGAALTARYGLQWAMLRESVLLLAVLMLFMGGRIIAPAAAGAIQRAGGHLEARVQPRIEAALLVAMLVALVLAAVPSVRIGAGLAVVVAGLLALVRLARWRLPACSGRPDLWCLGLGYGWLGAGLRIGNPTASFAGSRHRVDAINPRNAPTGGAPGPP